MELSIRNYDYKNYVNVTNTCKYIEGWNLTMFLNRTEFMDNTSETPNAAGVFQVK